MRRLITVLSLCTVGFAAFTVWEDPTTGPFVQGHVMALLPEGTKLPSFVSMPQSSGTMSENLGGMTAANRVTNSVVGAVSN